MEALKDVLINLPHVQVVYLNEKGEWSFNEKTGFATSKTRLEILGEDQAKEEGSKKKSKE